MPSLAPPSPAAALAAAPSSPPSPSPPTPANLYFVNAPVDYAVIGGVSLLTYLVLLLTGGQERSDLGVTLAAWLMWVCNWPHFAATSYRLYHSRANILQYPMTALVIPWVVLAACVGALLYPPVLAPYLIKVFLIWSPYHFSGQTLGVTLLYARRAGLRLATWERYALSSFIFATFLYPTIRSEQNAELTDEYYNIPVPHLGLPAWTVPVAEAWLYLTGAAVLFVAARWSWRRGRLAPPIVLVPLAAQLIWFVVGVPVRSFTEFVPFFHSLQYLFIAWSMQLKEKLDREQLAPSARYVLSESVRWGLLNFGAGVTLFFVLPRVAATFLDYPREQALLFATGVVIAGVQLHHFFVDGVIWKLKRTTVASPLMVNLSDLLHAPAPAKGGAA